MNDDFLLCVLRKSEWSNGRYTTKISGYANHLQCNSKRYKVIRLFRKITKFDSRENTLIVYLPCKPDVDIPIKYKLDKCKV